MERYKKVIIVLALKNGDKISRAIIQERKLNITYTCVRRWTYKGRLKENMDHKCCGVSEMKMIFIKICSCSTILDDVIQEF